MQFRVLSSMMWWSENLGTQVSWHLFTCSSLCDGNYMSGAFDLIQAGLIGKYVIKNVQQVIA